MKRKIYLWIMGISLTTFLHATNTIRGKVIDSNQEPIDAVAVILQTTDSVFVSAVVTDSDGIFLFEAEQGEYLLFFQHLLYENKMLKVTNGEVGPVELKEKDHLLGEVTVVGERPQVKVEGGTLIYDTPQLIRNKPVTNAFEAIKELPGITGNDDEIQLLGAGNLHIVINGQLTTMTLAQLINLLKTIPASRVQKTEVMYNAPARYNIKGALINVVIDQQVSEGELFQAEIGTRYEQRHYAMGQAHANLLYSTPQFKLDMLVNGYKGRTYGGEDMFARHTLQNEIVEINQINRGKSKPQAGSFRLGGDYRLTNQDKLSLAYYLEAGKTDARRVSTSTFNYLEEGSEVPNESRTVVDGNSTLQNVNLQYDGHQGIQAGVDYTHYNSPEHQHYINHIEQEKVADMLNDSKQNINKWLAFINHTQTIAGDWQLNYGINGSYTRSETNVGYSFAEDNVSVPDTENSLHDTQKEYGGNGFVEVSHKFGKFSATVSLKAEYFRSDYLSKGVETILWNDWAFFPNGSLSYIFSPFHILQLNVSSDKKYPSYWSVNPQTTYLNAYSVIQGNPSLKPAREYEAQLLYIFRQKYIFMAFWQYQPDKFAQLPYQQPGELRTVFRFENFDYSVLAGIGTIIPFSISDRLLSRVTLQGMRLHEKSDGFYDSPFNNSRYFGRIGMNNTLNISDAKPNLKLTVSGYYVSPAIQGLYKLGSQYDVSAGLKWVFANDKADLSFKYDNIFRSRMPRSIVVDTGSQYSRMKNLDTSRLFSVAFTWKFGGFKKNDHQAVDKSRFGK